jgi:hypothetical protein
VHPFLHLRADGRLCVRAGLRKGIAGDRLTVRWREAEEHSTPMQLVAQEDEHLLFEADLPASQAIAKRFGIDILIATEPEIRNNLYTGDITGTPCYREGKVERLNAWLKNNNKTLHGSFFYSDSHNDLPLLQKVDQPIAVDPDDKLKAFAEQHGWQVMSLR